MPRSHVSLRLWVSCWIVYCLHFATDFSREHFLTSAIVERHTFTLDPYLGMHEDIFRFTNGHAYHGANPGVSFLGSIPYFLLKPITDGIVERSRVARAASGDSMAADYQDPRPARREFYRKARENGWDIRFGLVGIITMVFTMAPLAATGAVLVHRTFLGVGVRPAHALGGALLYAFGTPVFFRAAYLNQNLAVAVFCFAAFTLLWNPGNWSKLTTAHRQLLAGLMGGIAFLCDYSGAVLFGIIGVYGLIRSLREGGGREGLRFSGRIALGAIGPVLLLWWYQWACFGNPFLPPQFHMPLSQALSDRGYRGVTGPSANLMRLLLIDPRFGLFITAPWLLLTLAAPFVPTIRSQVGRYELGFLLGAPLGLLFFFGSIEYVQLQYIHGIRYLIPTIPFLVIPAVLVLLRLPRLLTGLIGIGAVAMSWGMAMSRLEEQHHSILEGLRGVLFGGFRLPALTTLHRMAVNYAPELSNGVSPLPLFALTSAVLWLVWRVDRPGAPLDRDPD